MQLSAPCALVALNLTPNAQVHQHVVGLVSALQHLCADEINSELLHLVMCGLSLLHVVNTGYSSHAEESIVIRLGSSLVITAVGGGTAVIPFLTGESALLCLLGLIAQHMQAWRHLHCYGSLLCANTITMLYVSCSVRSVACILHILGECSLCLNIILLK